MTAARFIAPPVARLITHVGGRNAYAAMQLGTALLSLLSCVCVAPAISVVLGLQEHTG